jgi:hypothetical protein
MSLKFQVETWAKAIAEMRPLFRVLWSEVGVDKDKFGCDPDEDIYATLESRGALHVVTARADGKMVGFFIGMVFPHLHYRNSGFICTTDAYALHPDHRKGLAGARFFRFIEQSLRNRKVIKFYTSCKVEHDRSPMFRAMGYRLQDFVFVKCL